MQAFNSSDVAATVPMFTRVAELPKVIGDQDKGNGDKESPLQVILSDSKPPVRFSNTSRRTP